MRTMMTTTATTLTMMMMYYVNLKKNSIKTRQRSTLEKQPNQSEQHRRNKRPRLTVRRWFENYQRFVFGRFDFDRTAKYARRKRKSTGWWSSGNAGAFLCFFSIRFFLLVFRLILVAAAVLMLLFVLLLFVLLLLLSFAVTQTLNKKKSIKCWRFCRHRSFPRVNCL